MPPHRRGSSGYRGIRACSSSMFYVEIRSGDTCFGLGMFETGEEDACVSTRGDVRLARSRSRMNFLEVQTREKAQARVPLPQLITAEDRQIYQRRERRLLIAETDEQAMEV
ncbi:Ethylene-responsive transcription factor CRF1 [Hordeum vulgare]|nr:Ethylene-responsive transcription factor CRF1 [Hordeum vulgare]